MRTPRVTIVVVSYNAVGYARRMLRSIRRTTNIEFELVVVDNNSRSPARLFWTWQRLRRRVNRLALLERNTFVAEGCNIGVAMAARDSTHILLLNTDCVAVDARWLERLLAVHERGATGLRYIEDDVWPRADGFCILIDQDLCSEGLDENYHWWWSVTGLQARLLREGHRVTAVKEYEDAVVHFGGKSGTAWKTANATSIGWSATHGARCARSKSEVNGSAEPH